MSIIGAFLLTAAATDAALTLTTDTRARAVDIVRPYLPQVTYTPPQRKLRLPSVTLPRPHITLPTLPKLPALPDLSRRGQFKHCKPGAWRGDAKVRLEHSHIIAPETVHDYWNREPAPEVVPWYPQAPATATQGRSVQFPDRALTRKEITQVKAPEITTVRKDLPTDKEWAEAAQRPAPLAHGGDLAYEEYVVAEQGRHRSSAKRAARQAAKLRRTEQNAPRPRRNPAMQPIRGEYSVGLLQHGQGFRV